MAPDSSSNTPILLILFIAVIAVLSHIFDITGILEEFLSPFFVTLFSVTVSTYVVLFAAYFLHAGSLESHHPQPPLGLLGNLGGGRPGALIGEFLQVLSFIQVGRLILRGITFNGWNHDLTTLNEGLMSVIAAGLLASAVMTIFGRCYRLREDWHEIVESAKEFTQSFGTELDETPKKKQ